MASHFVVIDSSLKRATIKTTPSTSLSNVLEEACHKLGHKPDQFMLKHNDKTIDLSRLVRLSGLTTGAKLQLVQASRSPSVISVALQVAARGEGTSTRLQNKFPSSASIWQVLRTFETTAAGDLNNAAKSNFTQQASARMSGDGSTGSGRLYYSMPVVNVVGRELGTFTDLQKTLAQLGFNGGTCLLRLSFRDTDQPLEEAMMNISKYFEGADGIPSEQSQPKPKNHGIAHLAESSRNPPSIASDGKENDIALPAEHDVDAQPKDIQPSSMKSEPEVESAPAVSMPQLNANSSPSSAVSDAAGLTVYAPPSSANPVAASQVPFNEEDYAPTIAHAQLHQSRLNNESRNRRLLSDKEIEDDRRASAEKLQGITQVTIRIRFPDNSSVNKTFGRDATSATLYDLCRELMYRPNNEDFTIKYPGLRGSLQLLAENDKKLIMDLAWQARIVITVVWGDNVKHNGPSLKPQYVAQAQPIKAAMPGIQPPHGEKESEALGDVQSAQKTKRSGGDGGGGDIEKKLKGFLRLGKK